MSLKTINIPQRIMTTDVYISLYSDKYSDVELEKDLALCVKSLEDFEQKYSRFIKDNELDVLNNAEDINVSLELFNILTTCQKYYKSTNGLFDPTVYTTLNSEGYSLSKFKGYHPSINNELVQGNSSFKFDRVYLISPTKVIKPKDLKIDLGGIGKGYVIDKLTEILRKKYDDFCISVGGDMYLSGVDRENSYSYWAINIENPFNVPVTPDLPTLLVSNKAIATSGINKRTWMLEGVSKNHLIDTRTNKSISNELICATVISENVVYSDITAKILMILGLADGINYCKMNNVAAVLISNNQQLFLSERVTEYVWKP